MSREWVTVPAEPTPEMVEEICRSHTTEEWPNAFGASAQEIRRDYARAGWAAALAAAPHPTQCATYAAAREAAERERVRGVLRELVESYRSLINTLGHEDATAADKEKAEARFACAEAAARAELAAAMGGEHG